MLDDFDPMEDRVIIPDYDTDMLDHVRKYGSNGISNFLTDITGVLKTGMSSNDY